MAASLLSSRDTGAGGAVAHDRDLLVPWLWNPVCVAVAVPGAEQGLLLQAYSCCLYWGKERDGAAPRGGLGVL